MLYVMAACDQTFQAHNRLYGRRLENLGRADTVRLKRCNHLSLDNHRNTFKQLSVINPTCQCSGCGKELDIDTRRLCCFGLSSLSQYYEKDRTN